MVTKAEIIGIDYTSNTCQVRMPIFESTSSANYAIARALFAVQPGVFNGYTVGDVVFVAFEDNRIDRPVVIGKLYLGTAEESLNSGGAIYGKNLVINGTAELPTTTAIVADKSDDAIAGTTATYGTVTIKNLLERISDLETKVSTLQGEIPEDIS